MKKIRLDPHALKVHSFSTAHDAAVRPGTIRANQNDETQAACQTQASCPCFPPPDPGTIVVFCTNGGSCVDGACKGDTSPGAC